MATATMERRSYMKSYAKALSSPNTWVGIKDINTYDDLNNARSAFSHFNSRNNLNQKWFAETKFNQNKNVLYIRYS